MDGSNTFDFIKILQMEHNLSMLYKITDLEGGNIYIAECLDPPL